MHVPLHTHALHAVPNGSHSEDSARVSSWEGQDEVQDTVSQLRLQRALGIFLLTTCPASLRPHARFPSGSHQHVAPLYALPSC